MPDDAPEPDTPRPRPSDPVWRRYLRFLGPNAAADLDDELRDHLDSSMESLIARGLSPDAARAEALRRFGDVARIRREVRDMDERHERHTLHLATLDTLVADLRYGARGLRRSPVFTLVAALSIALGVAANTTVFSVINAVLLRPIPGANSDRLVRVYVNHHSPFSWSELAWFRERATSFEHLVGERYGAMAMRVAGGDAERVRTSYVTQGFFQALQVRMAAGRGFEVDDAAGASAAPTAVLSHAFWRRRFGGDPSIVGQVVTLAGAPVTIVGVTAPEFRSSVTGWTPELFIPLAAAPLLSGTRLEDFGGSLYTTGKLRQGRTAASASAELDALMAQLAATDSRRYARTTLRVDHIRGVHAELRLPIAAASSFLMLMVGLVLLIACANVANLLLGRATARRTEMGIRLAIGASRARLVRQLLTESLLLSALGAVLGLALASVLTRVLTGAIPPEAGLDRAFFAPDHRVLLFTAALCLLTALLFGLAPALRAASPHVVPLLKGDEPRTGFRRRRRGGLVAAQAALCVLLLAVASLFLRSLVSMRHLDPGFRADGVVDATLDLGLLNADETSVRAMFTRILELAPTLPGVEAATLAAIVPLGGSNMETRVVPEGMGSGSIAEPRATYFNVVGPGYFSTLEIPLHRGRDILVSDDEHAPPVAVINETAAARLWPDGDALGRRFRLGGADGALVEVVGIARDADYIMPGEDPRPVIHVPFAQHRRSEMVLHLRTRAGLGTVRAAVWDMMRELAPTLPPPAVRPMADDMAATVLPVRAGAALLGIFGVLALLLAAAGIYGVTAYSVERRTREIGIRAALGANRARILRMVLGESLRIVTAGSLLGLALALGAAIGLSRVLYGVRPVDPIVLPGVVALIALVAVMASLAPARRAAGVDPVRAIRTE